MSAKHHRHGHQPSRDDRQHRRHGSGPKRVFVYLRRDARVRLRGDSGRS
jgi:hypothetical protein